MKIFRAAVLVALLAGPAYGQAPNIGMNWIQDGKSKSPEEIEKDEARDKAYRNSLRKIPDAKPTASDPWGSVRGPDQKAAAQSKPRAKSGAASSQ